MHRRLFSFFAACALTCAPVSALANTEEENGDLLSTALAAIANDDWVTAEHFASQITDPTGVDLVVWERLRRGQGDWSEYQGFLARNSDWPGLKRLRRAGEDIIPKNHDPVAVRAYFQDQLPQTGTGAIRLADAYQAQGRTSEARAEVMRAWQELSLAQHEEDALIRRFGGVLTRGHQDRLDNLLWRKRTREAERMLEYLPDAQGKLAKARIGLQRASKGVDGLINSVPKHLQDDAGLAFDRFLWRVKKGRWDDAETLLAERTRSPNALGRPEAWSSRRRGFARRAMRANNIQLAYLLASQHGLSEGSNYADLEWLSGYLSLTYMKAPEQALAHFQRFEAAVTTPVSKGRAGYWSGRVYEKLGRKTDAANAYRRGAAFQTSFYGQLAAERIKDRPDALLSGTESFANWRAAEFVETGPMRAALLLHYAQDQRMVRWFFTHVAETLDRTELLQLAELALELDRPNVALGVAKEAAKRGIVLQASYFPVTELATYSVDVEPEIAMSIARRESELNEGAVSPAGAQGLMQLMPGTARDVSRDLGIQYSKARLTTDWRYNAKLGTAYLAGLLRNYEGSYLLAFAAYNAGPSNVDKWIVEYGDPRDSIIDTVNWVEHIPYRETRQYVMRVMESLLVYRARLNGQTPPIRLSLDLSRG